MNGEDVIKWVPLSVTRIIFYCPPPSTTLVDVDCFDGCFSFFSFLFFFSYSQYQFLPATLLPLIQMGPPPPSTRILSKQSIYEK